MAPIILIDDDEKLGQLISRYFAQFGLQVLCATRPSQGLKLIEQHQPPLLILDIMLPEQDGFEVCRHIRRERARYGDLPIIMLTARGDVTDRIVGLELGADDYLPKPFEPRELVARAQNILRRSKPAQPKPTPADTLIRADGLVLNLAKRDATLEQTALDLTTMEFELLSLLMRHSGRTFSRDQIMSELRGIDADLFSRAIDTLVSRLRHKLNDNDKPPRFIKTVWGRGYTFIAQTHTGEQP